MLDRGPQGQVQVLGVTRGPADKVSGVSGAKDLLVGMRRARPIQSPVHAPQTTALLTSINQLSATTPTSSASLT